MDTSQERTDDFSYKPIDPNLSDNQVQYNPNRKPTPDELMQRLYSKRIPEPTFDQDKADRLQKIANINQAGRGLSVLGGILASGLSAPVRRNAPDTTAPSIYSNYQANLDKYKSEKDANILRNYAKDVEDIKYGMSNAYRDQANELANKRQADWMKAKEMDNKLNYAKWSAEWDRNNKRDTEAARHNKVMESAAMIRANKTGTKQDDSDKIINTKYGSVTLSPGKASYLRDEALKNQNMLKARYPQLYEPSTSFDMSSGKMVSETKLSNRVKDDDLIRAYLEMQEEDNRKNDTKNLFNSDQFKKGEQEALNERRQQQAPPASTQTQTQPKKANPFQKKSNPFI